MTGWLEHIMYRNMLVGMGAVMSLIAGSAAMVLGIVALSDPSEISWEAITHGTLIVLLAVAVALVAMTLRMQPWRCTEHIIAMRAGDVWVHWTYDEASWQAANAYGKRKSVLHPVLVPARAQRAARGEVYIGRHGIYWLPGGYLPLDSDDRIRYESADLVDRPTQHIHIEVSEQFRTAYGWTRRTLTDVGVPPGCEDEARTVVERLRREVVNSDSSW